MLTIKRLYFCLYIPYIFIAAGLSDVWNWLVWLDDDDRVYRMSINPFKFLR